MAILTNPRNETDKSLLRKRKMENNAPLKPPEFKRDEMGRFERPGKTLSKTAKPNKKIEDNRDANGHLQKGHSGLPGAGRPPGSAVVTGELPLRRLGLGTPPIAILACVVSAIICHYFNSGLRRSHTDAFCHPRLICRNANGGEIQKPNKINVLTFRGLTLSSTW